jgi:hypothetical protein
MVGVLDDNLRCASEEFLGKRRIRVERRLLETPSG